MNIESLGGTHRHDMAMLQLRLVLQNNWEINASRLQLGHVMLYTFLNIWHRAHWRDGERIYLVMAFGILEQTSVKRSPKKLYQSPKKLYQSFKSLL